MDMIAENYIGCDVSKAMLDIFCERDRGWVQIANDEAAIATFVARLDRDRDFVVMEATGVYDRLLRHALAAADIAFSRHNPQHTHHFARSTGRRAKTDRMDARMLALYGRRHQPAAEPRPCEKGERLQALARRRDQLVEIRSKQKMLLQDAFDADVKADIEGLLEGLDQRIKAIEACIASAIRATDEMAKVYRLLTSAPGVSTVTALTLIAHMPELGHRSPKSIAALAGLAPIANQSGKHKGRSAIACGRARVRRALYMAALSAARHQRFNQAYTEIAARSASKKLALIAIARKLLVTLNAMIRDQKAFV